MTPILDQNDDGEKTYRLLGNIKTCLCVEDDQTAKFQEKISKILKNDHRGRMCLLLTDYFSKNVPPPIWYMYECLVTKL